MARFLRARLGYTGKLIYPYHLLLHTHATHECEAWSMPPSYSTTLAGKPLVAPRFRFFDFSFHCSS